MSALPTHPTELDRERFRDLTKAMQFGLEYDRLGIDGQYKQGMTESAFRVWWSVERERQLLQNLNQSQGVKLSELLARAEKAEAELAKLREQEPAGYVFGDWRGATTISAVKDSHFNTPLYAEPIPAPAVPEEWRKVMAENEIIKLQSEVDKADSLWMDWQLRCIEMEKQRNELLFLLRKIDSSSYGAPPSLFASRILVLLPNIRDLLNKHENTFPEENKPNRAAEG